MSVASAYAKALYQTATDSKLGPDALDQIESQIGEFAKLLDQSREVRVALLGPVTTPKEKTGAVEGLAKKLGLNELATSFLALLARKDRLGLVHEVRDAFINVRQVTEGGVVGTVVAADSVVDSDVKGLSEAFTRKLGKKVSFRVSTDTSLLAGMRVTVNGITYDGSLKSQLQTLRDRFTSGFSGN